MMAEVVSLVFATKPTKIDSVELDASIRETHTGEVELTDHPVEEGANITDHSRPKPIGLAIDGVITNTPISRTKQANTRTILGVTFTSSAAVANYIQGRPGYAEAAYAKLEDLRLKGNVITVVTNLKTYTSMVMTSLSIPRDKNTGDALSFSAQFRQVIIVKNKTTRKVVSKVAKPKTSTGKQPTKTPTDAQQKKSILYKLDESTGKGLSKLLTPSK